MVGAQYKCAEVAKADWRAVAEAPAHAVDAWGLGCLMQASGRGPLGETCCDYMRCVHWWMRLSFLSDSFSHLCPPLLSGPAEICATTGKFALNFVLLILNRPQQEIFSGSAMSSVDQLRRTEVIPPQLLTDYYQKLLASTPARRLNPAKLTESPFLKANKLVGLAHFMDSIAVRDGVEKEVRPPARCAEV